MYPLFQRSTELSHDTVGKQLNINAKKLCIVKINIKRNNGKMYMGHTGYKI
jgi:hypothetical protein